MAVPQVSETTTIPAMLAAVSLSITYGDALNAAALSVVAGYWSWASGSAAGLAFKRGTGDGIPGRGSGRSHRRGETHQGGDRSTPGIELRGVYEAARCTPESPPEMGPILERQA